MFAPFSAKPFLRRISALTGFRVIIPKHAFYYALKNASREAVAKDFLIKIKEQKGPSIWNGLLLSSITPDALTQARLEWPKYYSESTHLGFVDSWETIYKKFVCIPSFFDLAVWNQSGAAPVLQGLALGKPSDGKTHLTLNWVERPFGPDYFKGGVLLPILACAEEYARLLQCKRVLIKNPIDPSKYARYEYGEYRLHKVRARYLCKEL